MPTRPVLPPLAAAALLLLRLADVAGAGVVNPDISVIGQPFIGMTDDPGDPDRDRLRIDAGETELVFDAALNPYARGTVVAAAGEEGFGVEEAYVNLTRGLPGQLALKAGQYRAGFGRLNVIHPHALPFAERPHVLAEYLPGDEALTESGISISRLIPIGGDRALSASIDWLQGDTFRATENSEEGLATDPRRGETRPAVLGRLSGFAMLGERSALECGVSGIRGTNNVSARARTTLLGADARMKLWTSPRAYLVLQAEGIHINREGNEGVLANKAGGYLFADYNFAMRYNFGASFERYASPDATKRTVTGFGLFAGIALLEETTAFRASWNRVEPDGAVPAQTFTLRILYSMGPHRAHQF